MDKKDNLLKITRKEKKITNVRADQSAGEQLQEHRYRHNTGRGNTNSGSGAEGPRPAGMLRATVKPQTEEEGDCWGLKPKLTAMQDSTWIPEVQNPHCFSNCLHIWGEKPNILMPATELSVCVWYFEHRDNNNNNYSIAAVCKTSVARRKYQRKRNIFKTHKVHPMKIW